MWGGMRHRKKKLDEKLDTNVEFFSY